MDVREQIIEAFADTPRPPDGATSADTYDDEGTEEYFRGRPWQGHSTERLRHFESSMCFFTPQAFRYFLPAYMLAELDDPDEANAIAQGIAFHFCNFAEGQRPEFTAQELRAILAFFHECARRYDDRVCMVFGEAGKNVEDWIASLA
jgi:hypothetical protein